MKGVELIKKIFSQNSLNELDKFFKGEEKLVELKGVNGSSKAILLSYYFKGINVVILDNREEAQFFTNDLYNLIDKEKVFFFPCSKHITTNKITTLKDSSQKVQRSAAISELNSILNNNKEKDIVLVAYPASIYEKILNNNSLKKSILNIKKGEEISHAFLKDILLEYNFEKVDFVGEPGQFALRGSIIDLFSYSSDKPYRIDFFGDSVECIKEFDTNTQRSIRELEEIEIFPNIYDSNDYIDDNIVDIFEYIGENNCRVWINDYSFLNNDIYKDILSNLYKNKVLHFSSGSTENIIEFSTIPQPSFNKNFRLLLNDIRDKQHLGYNVIISSDNPKQIERLKNIFEYNSEIDSLNPPKFFELNFSLHRGFIDRSSKVCLYTDHQIFDKYHRVKIEREVPRSERLTLNELSAFQVGDYIVHIDMGVGVYGGLVRTNINGYYQEAIKLIYKDNVIVFISIHGIHKISKFKSKDGTPPRITKLGTGEWDRLKNKTKSKVKDIARDLIKLYAKRREAKGFAFSPDSYLQHELEASFIYEDTPDQIKTTQAVKEDMEKDYPMDRLVCGDVGFGKTEISIRAAFKAVADGKQVALLVPTTILALQHYKTYKKRLKEFPCNIQYLSRLKSAKEIKDIAKDLKEGKIDIIIGTHRLLNKEIKFKDLGLLIIDEEQKFGVAAKEKLRELKLAVDTLTLTATPIPRTLQFSLLGARDLSIINTPPPNRLPVQTEIIDFNEDYIRDIINFEIERGGQVYFVHNRVEDILSIEDIIRRICPGVKTCVGHGKMEPKELESRILEFMAGDYDVLIATTIVENGIDIPNANTIIINQAQNFGLSDLHQLRGRVGRSNQKAFCYLIVPQMLSISDDAKRRLRAIEAFSDLGSGFNIAMQDLDIRGAGNLLGGEQSGFIADMGFETYQKILSEAFLEIKQEEMGEESIDESAKGRELLNGNSRENSNNRDIYNKALESNVNNIQYIVDCSIDTDLELLIPNSYVSNTSERIRLYKELDNITNNERLDKFLEDLRDRFGEIPKELTQLTFIVRLRWIAVKLGFEKIVLMGGKMFIYFVFNQQSPYYKSSIFASIMGYINNNGRGVMSVKEQNNKLMIIINNINSVEMAFNIVDKVKSYIFANL